MNKTVIVLGICVLIIGMPVMTAYSFPRNYNLKESISIFEKIRQNKEDIPKWADGTMNGSWGLREFLLFNMIEIPIGNITGYYGKLIGPFFIISGKIYPFFNSSKTTNISGIFFGPVVFGKIGDINLTIEDIYGVNVNETTYVGIGDQDKSIFNWRIMGRTGPTLYLKGNFEKFL